MPHVTFLNSSLGDFSGWTLFMVGIALLLWLWSVVEIANKKTEDPFDRIVWLLVVLALNFVGTLLYLFFADSEESKARVAARTNAMAETEAKRMRDKGII